MTTSSHPFNNSGKAGPAAGGLRSEPPGYDDRLRRLTPRQKDCLRLARPGHSSKLIARELGISPLRVDAHIGDAQRVLGTRSRFEAARRLRAWEQHATAGSPRLPLGAQSMALSKVRGFSSDEGTDDTANVPQANPPQMALSDRDLPPGAAAGMALHRTVRPVRSKADEKDRPSFFALSVSIAAILAALGSVAALLLAFDWFAHS